MRHAALFLLAALLTPTACARPAPTVAAPAAAPHEDPAAAAVADVRSGYFGRDWWACARAGEAHLRRHPDSAPLRAWTIACAARAGEDAAPLADAMLAERPGDPWALFARASALIDDLRRPPAEAIDAARAAAQALDHPDTTWVLARALVVRGPRPAAAEFLAAAPRRDSSPELVALELAHLTEKFGKQEEDEVQMRALADKLRALDPTFADGWFLPGLWFTYRQRSTEAEPLFRQALERSPHSPAIHARLWDTIVQSPARSPADKRAAIEASVTAFLRARGDSPAGLAAAAHAYDDLSPETAAGLRRDLLARFPTSLEAEWARIGEIRRLSRARSDAKQQGRPPDPAAEQALRAALDAFIAAPHHREPELLGEAHMHRYFLVEADPNSAPEALLAAAQGVAAHERRNIQLFKNLAVTLAERTPYAAEAEAIAREGLRLAAQPLELPPEYVERETKARRALLLCGLGAALIAQRRLPEAREALQEAAALFPDRIDPLLGLAALAEAEGRPADAERHLLDGLALEFGADQAEAPLKALYVRRHRGDRGYATYRAGVARDLLARRRAAVLATAIAEPKPLAPFALPRLAGGDVRSDGFTGRITVINIWAVYCSPCVRELPELQKLADAYAGAPDVRFTTINTDENTDSLAAWMTERSLRLEVLLGADWFRTSGYRGVPTTLFLDPQGRVVFAAVGKPDRLVEEYTWRIESMRAKGKPGRRRSPQLADATGASGE